MFKQIFPRSTIAANTIALVSAFAISLGLAASKSYSDDTVTTTKKEKVATLAGGCFWCTEACFERMKGVNAVVSGYIGGHVPNPTYEQVIGMNSGHAEAVQVYYDPSKVTYEELLQLFFKIHDPTTLNRQGADTGPHYRSSIFYHDDAQKRIATEHIKKLDKELVNPIVTKLEKATKFYPAEEYHQDYFRKNPNAGYCRAVVAKKVRDTTVVLAVKGKLKTEAATETVNGNGNVIGNGNGIIIENGN